MAHFPGVKSFTQKFVVFLNQNKHSFIMKWSAKFMWVFKIDLKSSPSECLHSSAIDAISEENLMTHWWVSFSVKLQRSGNWSQPSSDISLWKEQWLPFHGENNKSQSNEV